MRKLSSYSRSTGRGFPFLFPAANHWYTACSLTPKNEAVAPTDPKYSTTDDVLTMRQLKHTSMPVVKHAVAAACDALEMSIGQRIKDRRLELNIIVADLAKAASVTVQAVYQWESGDTKGLKPENLVAVAECLKTTEKWLATGRGQRDKVLTGETLTQDEDAMLRAYRQLPDDGKLAVSAIIRQLANPQKPQKGQK